MRNKLWIVPLALSFAGAAIPHAECADLGGVEKALITGANQAQARSDLIKIQIAISLYQKKYPQDDMRKLLEYIIDNRTEEPKGILHSLGKAAEKAWSGGDGVKSGTLSALKSPIRSWESNNKDLPPAQKKKILYALADGTLNPYAMQ